MTTRGRPVSTPSLAARLVSLDLSDQEVDACFPAWARELSRVHWTPVGVARRAAEFLTEDRRGDARLLDVGSGVGKFCVLAAAMTGARCTGIEHNIRLVEVARDFAAQAGVVVEVQHAGIDAVDWSRFNGIYFYNPFAEHFIRDGLAALRGGGDPEEGSMPLYLHDLRTALAKLYLMPTGTRVATFHGLGASLPPGYEYVGGERYDDGVLRFYIRRDPRTLAPSAHSGDGRGGASIFDEPAEDPPPGGYDPLDDL